MNIAANTLLFASARFMKKPVIMTIVTGMPADVEIFNGCGDISQGLAGEFRRFDRIDSKIRDCFGPLPKQSFIS